MVVAWNNLREKEQPKDIITLHTVVLISPRCYLSDVPRSLSTVVTTYFCRNVLDLLVGTARHVTKAFLFGLGLPDKFSGQHFRR